MPQETLNNNNNSRKMRVATYHSESTSDSSAPTSTSLDQSLSSCISAITVDEDTFEMAASSRFSLMLTPTPEQQASADSDIQDIRQYLDCVRMTSSRRFCTTITPSTETQLCPMPQRKSSAQTLDYSTAHDKEDDLEEEENDYYSDPLQGSFYPSGYESFHTGLQDPSSSYNLPDGGSRFLSYPPVAASNISLDLDDVFEVNACLDTSPVAAKRISSASLSAAARRADLCLNINEDATSVSRPSFSSSARFRAPCSKSSSSSVTMPSRRDSRKKRSASSAISA